MWIFLTESLTDGLSFFRTTFPIILPILQNWPWKRVKSCYAALTSLLNCLLWRTWKRRNQKRNILKIKLWMLQMLDVKILNYTLHLNVTVVILYVIMRTQLSVTLFHKWFRWHSWYELKVPVIRETSYSLKPCWWMAQLTAIRWTGISVACFEIFFYCSQSNISLHFCV